MKKILLTCLMALGTGLSAQTNIAGYSFTKSTGTAYTPLTGGSVFASGSYDDSVSSAITLSSPFPFGGTTVTTCYISTNGFITFGAAPLTYTYTPLSTLDTGTLGAVSAFAQDAGPDTASNATAAPEIRYQDLGTEFVVQYKDHANYYNRSSEKLNFQIHLVYATGEINVVYGNNTNPGTTSTSGTIPQVGIRGNSVTYASNVNNLMISNVPAGTTCDWSKAVTGTASGTMLFSGTTNVNVKIPTGLKYTWMPGTQLPVRTFTATTGVTNSGATLTWAAPAGAAAYNVQYRVLGSCDWTNFSGNPVSAPTVTLAGLTQNTTYQVQVQALNGTVQSIYSHIPNAAGTGNGYTTSGSFTTLANCASTVTGLTSSAVTPETATISWTASTTPPGSGYEYYYSTSSAAPASNATPSGSTAAGIVTANIAGLTPGTTYYYWIRGNCNATDKGVWSGSANFATLSLCPTVSVPAAGALDVSVTPTITWTAVNGATSYKLRVGTTAGGTDVFNNIDLGNVTSYTFSSPLNLSTKYYYSVSGYTATTPSVTCSERAFTTVCGAENAPTANQAFSSFVPSCWNLAKGDVAANSTLTYVTNKWLSEAGFGNTGSNTAVRINLYGTNTGDWLISQPINLGTTAGAYRVKYKMAVTNYLGTTSQTTLGTHLVRVIISTDGGATWSNANVLKTYTGAGSYSSAGQTETVNLTGYSGTVKIAFVASTSSTSPDIDFHIDDFVVEAVPACAEPTSLMANSITSSGATISWTAPANAPGNGYQLYYSTSSTALTSTATPNISGITGNSQAISGLAPATMYYAWVRSNCGASTTSPWSSAVSFTTSCIATTTLNENFDTAATGSLPVCWTSIGSTASYAAVTASSAVSAPNALYIYTTGTSTGMAATPELSNLQSGNYTLKFKGRANLTAGGIVQIGYLTNPADTSTFVMLGSYTASSTAVVDNYSLDITGVPAGVNRLVFKHTGVPSNSVLIDDITYQLNPNLATSETSVKSNSIKAYPNPFSDVLNISDISNVKNILVTDVAGRLVKTIANPSSELHLGELKQGMYLVILEMKDGSKQTIKTIKR
ncbi:T9SS type A sorting domain-containing protein [Chryseobacterium sp. SN22]|uniref:fibronectin type III domain-containing protein n=1 Tax=Chryseobacterium sp. SN22 TaxID=2606431 RepID=UPI0011EF03C7|nr:fibronectin type III domain-containing protein [Chryseobacterium sp. SN22]KAA0130811.1 T9SS type A sorting domain-containing protein [Chryseobacterium sp. SN22]